MQRLHERKGNTLTLGGLRNDGSYSAEVSKSHISPGTSRKPKDGQGGGLTDG
ncbi:hypothetical protein [Mucilaginibacter sp.]|uniref:hypothetical protein n=1 Tax=Mucilaginibacter sp. TaxID=1882438 RepID=UPI002852CD7D|nr:hypothetical protein [Mucilaginibacter sp.]